MARVQFELPDHFIFTTEVQIYVSHVNQAGHLDNAQLLTLVSEGRHAEFMDQVMSATAEFEYAEINILDGMRADFVDSWGLIRPSNTTPCLTLRFEGDDPESLEDVKSRFRKMIKGIDSSLKLPF